jgi:hypothetical protein
MADLNFGFILMVDVFAGGTARPLFSEAPGFSMLPTDLGRGWPIVSKYLS